jgi:hypothetical protein
MVVVMAYPSPTYFTFHGGEEEEHSDVYMLKLMFDTLMARWMRECNESMELNEAQMERFDAALGEIVEGKAPVCVNAYEKVEHLIGLFQNTFTSYSYCCSSSGPVKSAYDYYSKQLIPPVVHALRRFRYELNEKRRPTRAKLERELEYVKEALSWTLKQMVDQELTFEAYAKQRVPYVHNLPMPHGFMDASEYATKLKAKQAKYSRLTLEVRARAAAAAAASSASQVASAEKEPNKQQMKKNKRGGRRGHQNERRQLKQEQLFQERDAAFADLWTHVHHVRPVDGAAFRRAMAPLVARELELSCKLLLWGYVHEEEDI